MIMMVIVITVLTVSLMIIVLPMVCMLTGVFFSVVSTRLLMLIVLFFSRVISRLLMLIMVTVLTVVFMLTVLTIGIVRPCRRMMSTMGMMITMSRHDPHCQKPNDPYTQQRKHKWLPMPLPAQIESKTAKAYRD